MAKKPRVVIVDDHALFRAGVASELAEAVDVVGQAEDVESAIVVIRREQPDVVLLDVHLPGGNGQAVISAVDAHGDAALAFETRFLALSVSDAPDDVLALIRAGARGYVTKSISAAELADAVWRVHSGDAVFSPKLAGFVLDAFAKDPPVPAPAAAVDAALDVLTPREHEVMRYLARGYAYKEIARELSISLKTVESHASAVLRKLQLSNRRELTRWVERRRP